MNDWKTQLDDALRPRGTGRCLAGSTLAGMAEMQKEAMLYESLENLVVNCFLCSHHCRIKDGETGFLNVRINRGHHIDHSGPE
jgi:hypothetical protein